MKYAVLSLLAALLTGCGTTRINVPGGIVNVPNGCVPAACQVADAMKGKVVIIRWKSRTESNSTGHAIAVWQRQTRIEYYDNERGGTATLTRNLWMLDYPVWLACKYMGEEMPPQSFATAYFYDQ